jgi:hypothetical protein
MLKNCPRILFQKFLFTILIGVGCLIIGAAYYIFSKDNITLALSFFVFIFSIVRSTGLYNIISKKKYEMIEGTCVSVEKKLFIKQYKIKIIDDNGVETSLRLVKQAKIKTGFRYCFYFRQEERLSSGSEYFDTALFSEHLLGFEELGEFIIQTKEPDISSDVSGNSNK